MTDTTTTTSTPEGQPVSKQFAQAMLKTFNTGLRFMNPNHIKIRHRQLNECIKTGWMTDELKAVYRWTQMENPRLAS